MPEFGYALTAALRLRFVQSRADNIELWMLVFHGRSYVDVSHRLHHQKGTPDLIEQIRLSLAQIESKKADANHSRKPERKAPTVAKKRPQKVRA